MIIGELEVIAILIEGMGLETVIRMINEILIEKASIATIEMIRSPEVMRIVEIQLLLQ